ncbi:MAG TPA: DMT family transporter [Candidatus Saccharimonadales bacterium]|nr:DMT family transporter [Candidatus Saccharimonadales bacterium]
MWFLYALASALFASVRRTSEKQLSHKLNHFTLGWTVQMAALPVLLLGLLAFGPIFNPFTLGVNFWLPTILIWIGFYPLNQFLYINAFRHGELSKILPLSSLGPVISLLLGWLLLSQIPSLIAMIGIFVIVIGIYVLNLKGRYLHNPLKIFTADKANLYTLLGLIINSAAGVLDKRAIDASGPMYYSFVSTLGAVVVMFILARVTGVSETPQIKQQAKPLLITGVLFGLSYAAYILALGSGPLAYVIAVRSGAALLIGSLIGFWFLKEPFTKPKFAALILILAGSTLLAVG